MRVLRTAAALLATAGLTLAAGALTAGSARAAEPGLTLTTQDTYYVMGDESFEISLGTVGGSVGAVRDVTVDLSAFTDRIRLHRDDLALGCFAADLVVTCHMDPSITRFTPFSAEVTDLAHPDFDASIPVTATAEGAQPATGHSHFILGRTQLRTAALPPRTGVRPGTAVPFSPVIGNKGEAAAQDGVTVLFRTSDRGADAGLYGFAVDGARPANCHYAKAPRTDFWCAFDGAVAAGTVYTTDRPLEYRTRQPLMDGDITYEMWPTGTRAPSHAPRAADYPERGDGPALKLLPSSEGTWDLPTGRMHVTSSQHADYQAVGATVRAERGDVVRVPLGVRNAGPGSVTGAGSDGALDVTLPAGTTLVSVRAVAPAGDLPQPLCVAGKAAHTYHCPMPAPLLLHQRYMLRFTLRVDRLVPGAKGWVRVVQSAESPARDRDRANDVAPLRVLRPGGAASGGAGASAGASSPGGSGALPDGELAASGAAGWTLVGASAGALLLGATAVSVTRRRRTR